MRHAALLRLVAWPLTLVAALGLFGISINGTLALVASEVHPVAIGEPRRPMLPPAALVKPEEALVVTVALPEAVPAPSAIASSSVALQQVMVVSDGLVMHGAPGTGSTRVWVLQQGEVVDLLDRRDKWLRVRQRGLEGWVYAANTKPLPANATWSARPAGVSPSRGVSSWER
ncbi:MAG: SH3 domain-containing protein [Devosia sp.]